MSHDPAARLQEMKARQFVESSLSSILLEVEEVQAFVVSQLDFDGEETGQEAVLPDAMADALGSATVKIDQITAALQMAELAPVALLASHIKTALQSLIEKGLSPTEKQRRCVFESLFLLQRYLKFMHGLGGDVGMPPVLAPAFFSLSSAGLAPFVDEYQLAGISIKWNQDLVFDGAEDAAAVRRLRKMYQLALIGLLRGNDQIEDCREQFKLLTHVAERAYKLSGNELNQCCWKLLQLLVDAFSEGALKLNQQRRHLFARFDRILKELQASGSRQPNKAVFDACIAGSTYLLDSGGRGDQASALLPEQIVVDPAPWSEAEIAAKRAEIESGLKEALGTMTEVVKGLFNDLKTRMGIMEESDVCEEADVRFLTEKFKSIYSVVDFCGFTGPAKQLSEALQLIEAWQVCQPSHEELLTVANILLVVENQLISFSLSDKGIEQSKDSGLSQEQVLTHQAHQHLFEEMRANIGLANRAIGSYLDSDYDREHIANIADCLQATTGGFKIIGVDIAAELMQNCANLVDAEYRSKIPPEPGRLESLADSLISTEYLLHELTEGRAVDAAMKQLLQQNLDAISHELAA